MEQGAIEWVDQTNHRSSVRLTGQGRGEAGRIIRSRSPTEIR
jgi:hypothetical protein